MVLEARKRCIVAQCNCGSTFQGTNLKKHVRNKAVLKDGGHGKERAVQYCATCNAWGVENEPFTHERCVYVRLSRSNMLRVLQRQEPEEREALVKQALALKATSVGRSEETASEADAERPPGTVASSVEDEEETRRRKEDEAAVAAIVGSSEEKEKDKTDRKRIRYLSASSSSESDFESGPCQRPRTSSPTVATRLPSPRVSPVRSKATPFLPRASAVPISQTFAKNALVDENSRLSKQVASLQRDLGIRKGKEDDCKRLTAELLKKNGEIKRLREAASAAELERAAERRQAEEQQQAAEAKLRESEAERAREKEESEKRIAQLLAEREDFQSAVSKLQSWGSSLKTQLAEKDTVVEKLRQGAATTTGTLHIECKDGRIGATHVEQNDSDETICCFSDEGRGVRCHHVFMRGSDIACRAKNVRWPSERKLTHSPFQFQKCI